MTPKGDRVVLGSVQRADVADDLTQQEDTAQRLHYAEGGALVEWLTVDDPAGEFVARLVEAKLEFDTADGMYLASNLQQLAATSGQPEGVLVASGLASNSDRSSYIRVASDPSAAQVTVAGDLMVVDAYDGIELQGPVTIPDGFDLTTEAGGDVTVGGQLIGGDFSTVDMARTSNATIGTGGHMVSSSTSYVRILRIAWLKDQRDYAFVAFSLYRSSGSGTVYAKVSNAGSLSQEVSTSSSTLGVVMRVNCAGQTLGQATALYLDIKADSGSQAAVQWDGFTLAHHDDFVTPDYTGTY